MNFNNPIASNDKIVMDKLFEYFCDEHNLIPIYTVNNTKFEAFYPEGLEDEMNRDMINLRATSKYEHTTYIGHIVRLNQYATQEYMQYPSEKHTIMEEIEKIIEGVIETFEGNGFENLHKVVQVMLTDMDAVMTFMIRELDKDNEDDERSYHIIITDIIHEHNNTITYIDYSGIKELSNIEDENKICKFDSLLSTNIFPDVSEVYLEECNSEGTKTDRLITVDKQPETLTNAMLSILSETYNISAETVRHRPLKEDSVDTYVTSRIIRLEDK